MKRFYNYILSLLLLMVAGVTGAMAQNIQQGELLTTTEQVVSQDILLISIGQYGTGFAAGTGAYTLTVGNENVFRFEATGKTSADGHPTYYLKHVASGKYFEDYVIPMDNEDSSDAPKEGWDDPTGLTADKAQAIELVVCPFQTENAESARDYATPGNNNENDLSFEGFVLTRAEYITREGGDKTIQFLGHLGKPFYSINNETNVWHIYGADKVKGKDLLLNYNEYYFAGGATLEGLYPVGTEVGTYKQTCYDAANKVYTEFQAAINNYTLDDAAAQALVDRLIEAMEALKTKGFNGFKPGYYYIHNMSGRTLYSQNVNGVDFLYSSNTNNARPAEPTLDDVKYIWRIDADRDADNALVMTNAASGKSISGVKAAVAGVDEGFGFTLREDGKVRVEFGTAAPAEGMYQKTFTFTSMEATVGGNAQKQFHAKFNDGAVMGWNASDGYRNNFYFTSIADLTAEKIEDMKKQAIQDALNDNLANAYTTAKIAMANGYITTSEGGTNHDATFSADDVRALVKDASQWYCNKQDSVEGTLAALTDNVLNDVNSFFHTDWHASRFTPSLYTNHFLVATLDEPISGGVDVKFCKRLNTMNDYPTVFAIYGSNDFDANTPDAATWKLQGISSVDFSDAIEVTMEDGTVRNPAVGIASCALDGAYKYIKLAAIKTNSGNGFWAVSELNLWQAESVSSTKTPEFNEIPAEVLAKLEGEATKAEAELTASKATQAQIDALNAAYEEFKASKFLPAAAKFLLNRSKWKVSVSSGNRKDVIIDGDGSTYWGSSGSLPQFIQIDLGSEQEFNALAYLPESGYYSKVKDYKLYVSDTPFENVSSGKSAADIVNVLGTADIESSFDYSNDGNKVTLRTYTCPKMLKGRYVLFVTTSNREGSSYGASCAEFYLAKDPGITYHFKVNGVEYGKRLVGSIGDNNPIPTMPFLKNGELTPTTDGYDIACTEKELPFVAQSTFDANTAQWYALNINGTSGNYLLSNKGGSIVSTTTVSLDNHPDVLEDAYLWAFVGNLKDGYRIYSKVDQKSLALYNQLILKKGNGSLFKLYEKSNKSNFGLYVDEGKLLTRESENKIVASTEDNNNDRSTFRVQKSKLYVTNYAKPFFTLLNENDTEAPENAIWGILYLNSPTNRANYRALFLAANSDDATNEQIAALAAENVKIANEENVIPFEEGKYYRLYNAENSRRWLNVALNAENTSTLRCDLNAEKSVTSVVNFVRLSYNYDDAFSGGYNMKVKGLSMPNVYISAVGNRFKFYNAGSLGGYLGCESETANFHYSGDNNTSQWFVVPATEAEIAMSEVNGKSYASAYLPFPVNGVGGAEAYVGKLNDAKDMLNMTQVQGVAANTGFVLVGNADKATLSIGETTETATSDLKGSNTNIVISSPTVDLHDQYLVFGVSDGNVGFYAPSYYLETIPANKAYLETDQLASKAIAMNFGGNVTGVSQATVVANEDAPIYDLSGRRVAKAVKGGVYIQNGKKFVK